VTVYCISTSRCRNVPITVHIECLQLFDIFRISVLVVVLKKAFHFCDSRIAQSIGDQLLDDDKGLIHVRGSDFSSNHHLQPGPGANPVSYPMGFSPPRWKCQNVTLTPHFYPLRRFLHWFGCAIDNMLHIVLTVFSITTSYKLCKNMLCTVLLGFIMALTKTIACTNSDKRAEFLINCI
jgi:hypothetical protein